MEVAARLGLAALMVRAPGLWGQWHEVLVEHQPQALFSSQTCLSNFLFSTQTCLSLSNLSESLAA